MSNKTRKHIWPVSLVMSIAIIGALAAFIVLAANPGSSSAHGPDTRHDLCSDERRSSGMHDAFAQFRPDPSAPTATATATATAATLRPQ